MSPEVTHVLAMLVRVVAIGAIVTAFYATIGLGETPQLLAIGAAAAFGSQAAAYGIRRIGGDPRARPLVIVALAVLAIAAGVTAIVLARA